MLIRSYKLFSALLILMIVVSQTMTVSLVSAYDVGMNQMDMGNMSDDDHKNCCNNSSNNSICPVNYPFSNSIMLNNITFIEVNQTSPQKYKLSNSRPSCQLSFSLFRPPIIS